MTNPEMAGKTLLNGRWETRISEMMRVKNDDDGFP
jgi:hypothetical protein